MKQSKSMKSIRDPVCGMTVIPESTGFSVSIEDKQYYFCAESCRKSFVENPKKFMEPECDKPNGWWGRYMAKLKKATDGKPMKCH